MQKSIVLLAVVAALVVPAMAAPTVSLTASGGSWPNTPYNVNIQDIGDSLWVDNGVTANFQTFCVEWDRVFYTNTTYWATIDDVVMYGGSQSALANQTRQIYAAFLNGHLSGVAANNIQSEIWYWENGGMAHTVHSFSAKNQGVYASLNASQYDGWQNVRVLNLWTNSNLYQSGDVQSQMVRVTPSSPSDPKPIPVPAPGAVLLTGIGTTLVGWLRRRRTL